MDVKTWLDVNTQTVDKMKKCVWQNLVDSLGEDYMNVLSMIAASDDEAPGSPCRVSVLRVVLQLARSQ
jgi:hypothetical protein